MQTAASTPTDRRIVMLTTQLGGGIGRVLNHLAHSFADQGIDVHILLSRGWGEFVDDTRRYATLHTLRSTHAWFGIPELVRHLRALKPDAIITDTPRLTHLAARSVRFVFPSPTLIAVVHSTYSVKFSELPVPKQIRRLRRMRRLYPKVDHCVAVSAGVADDLSEVLGMDRSAIDVIYNPVLPPGGMTIDASTDPLKAFRAPGEPVILGMGRMCAAKDFATLIRAFDQVRRHLPSRLVLFGDGEEREHLQRLVEHLDLTECAHLPGYTPHAYEAMANADVFVLSSRWEGFGNVLVEALAAGTPVVSTDCPNGPKEILDNGRIGCLVPVGDDTALANAVMDTLQTPPNPEELRQAARRFSSCRATSKYLQLVGTGG